MPKWNIVVLLFTFHLTRGLTLVVHRKYCVKNCPNLHWNAVFFRLKFSTWTLIQLEKKYQRKKEKPKNTANLQKHTIIDSPPIYITLSEKNNEVKKYERVWSIFVPHNCEKNTFLLRIKAIYIKSVISERRLKGNGKKTLNNYRIWWL